MLSEDAGSYYILMERMHSDFKKYIETDDAADTFRDSIIMICLALKSLYETVKFNHRDFKPDNIMFDKAGSLRIIDFGFCCLNYGGMKISSTYATPIQLVKHCNVRSRDINALFYYILNHTRLKALDCPIKRVIKALMYSKQGDPLDWKNTYGKYNGRPELTNLLPENVIKVFSHLEFEGNAICGEINPSWASHIASINEGLLTNLKEAEIGALNAGLLKEFLSQKKSVTITQRVLKSTKNSDIQGFCESLLRSISSAPTNKSKSGGKKMGRRTRRKGRLLN